jgi:hypothetical protein
MRNVVIWTPLLILAEQLQKNNWLQTEGLEKMRPKD